MDLHPRGKQQCTRQRSEHNIWAIKLHSSSSMHFTFQFGLSATLWMSKSHASQRPIHLSPNEIGTLESNCRTASDRALIWLRFLPNDLALFLSLSLKYCPRRTFPPSRSRWTRFCVGHHGTYFSYCSIECNAHAIRNHESSRTNDADKMWRFKDILPLWSKWAYLVDETNTYKYGIGLSVESMSGQRICVFFLCFDLRQMLQNIDTRCSVVSGCWTNGVFGCTVLDLTSLDNCGSDKFVTVIAITALGLKVRIFFQTELWIISWKHIFFV